MDFVLEFITDHPIATFFITFVGPIFAWEIYQHHVRPLFIPQEEIKRIADDLIEEYGPDAEQYAYIEEDSEWRRSHTYKRGIWRRIRRELQRRYRAGEWE